MFFSPVNRACIKYLTLLCRCLRVREYAIPFRVQSGILVLNGLLNAVLAAVCGILICLSVSHTPLMMMKIAACLVIVGYRWRAVPCRCSMITITEYMNK